jgi:hypothetical protein
MKGNTMSSATYLHNPITISMRELEGTVISITVKSESSEVCIFLNNIDELVNLTNALKSSKYDKVTWLN